MSWTLQFLNYSLKKTSSLQSFQFTLGAYGFVSVCWTEVVILNKSCFSGCDSLVHSNYNAINFSVLPYFGHRLSALCTGVLREATGTFV